jgi:hypothetical protein
MSVINKTPLQLLIEGVVGTGKDAAKTLENERNHSLMSLKEKMALNNQTDNSTQTTQTNWGSYI